MVKSCITDLLLQGPASSVEVEKQHANLQLDAEARRSNVKRATPIQRDAYIMSAFLEHSAVARAVSDEVLGGAKSKVSRIFRRTRLLDTSAPGGGLRPKRKRLTEHGTVKGHDGLLKGMLLLACICVPAVSVFCAGRTQ